VHNTFTDVRNSVSKLMALNDHIMYQTASELKHRSNRAIMPGIVAIVSALIFTFVFNYFINYYITSPLIKIIRGIKAFITKKIPYNVEIDTNDELFELSSAIADLCERASVISETDK
jgi:signal transduction histidine kinase